MHVRPLHYKAFLLRLWQEQSTEAPVWRFSLEDPSSGQRLGFADLAALTTFLLQTTSESEDLKPEITRLPRTQSLISGL